MTALRVNAKSGATKQSLFRQRLLRCARNDVTLLVCRHTGRYLRLLKDRLDPIFPIAVRHTRKLGQSGSHLLNVPPCQRSKSLRLSFLPLGNLLEILLPSRTTDLSSPRMANHVTPLKIGTVLRNLKHQIFRKMLGIITNVQTRDENWSPYAWCRCDHSLLAHRL